MRPRKYHVALTEDERESLLGLVKRGKTKGYKITRAQILLALDENSHEKIRTGKDIAECYHVGEATVIHVAKQFINGGIELALERKKQENRHHKITGAVEAQMIAIACTDAPQGRSRWTLQLIADRLVELKVVDSISATAVGTTLKKRNKTLAL